MRRQEMYMVMEECRRLLLDKALQFDRHNAESNPQSEAPQLPLTSAWGHGLGLQLPQSQPQFHPIHSSQRFQAPFPLPHLQPQFDPSSSFGNQAPFPWPHSQPQFDLNGSFGNQFSFPSPHSQPQFGPGGSFEDQSPSPLPRWQPQFYPNCSFGNQALSALPHSQHHQLNPRVSFGDQGPFTCPQMQSRFDPKCRKSAQRDVHSNSGEHMAPNVCVTYEQQRSQNTVESSNVSNHLDNTSVYEDMRLAQKDVHSNYSVCKVSGINDRVRHTGEKTSSGHEEQSLTLLKKASDTDDDLAYLAQQMDFTKQDFKAYKIHVKGPNPLAHLITARQPKVVGLPVETPLPSKCQKQELEAAIKNVEAKINQETDAHALEKLLQERIHIESVSKWIISKDDGEDTDQGAGASGDAED